MSANMFALSNHSDLFVLLSFRAKNLTHPEKIDIVLEIERQLMETQFADKHLHLLWSTGYVNGVFTLWSESNSEYEISFDHKQTLIEKSKLEVFQLPVYLDKKQDANAQFIVFPEESYIRSMLKTYDI